MSAMLATFGSLPSLTRQSNDVSVVRIHINFDGYPCNSYYTIVRKDGNSSFVVVNANLKVMYLF